MRRPLTYAILAAPILFVATVADAQQQKRADQKRVDQMSDEAIAARRACFEEVQARFPGAPAQNVTLSSQRETAYRSCISRKGFRP